MSKRRFASLVQRFVPLVRRQSVSYFELTAAMAFEAFSRADVDYAVVEVGLGGRLDATNLTNPDVSVITRIGLDHTRVLGGSIRKIAGEKAGIMRQAKPVVVARQQEAAMAELLRRARAVGAVMVPVGSRLRDWDVRVDAEGVGFAAFSDLGPGSFSLPVLGRHQVENCTTALVTLGLLSQGDKRVRVKCVRRGLAGVSIPARCQVVGTKPTVVVDSCHNPDSGEALARTIAEHLGQRVVLVYGSLKGKMITSTVRPIVPWVKSAVLVRPDSPRAAELPRLKRIFGRFGLPYVAANSVPEALELAGEASAGETPIVVAGSFYLAGEVLQHVRSAPGDAAPAA